MDEITLNFSKPLNVSVQVGDTIYYTNDVNGKDISIIGLITGIASTAIVAEISPSQTRPTVNSFILFSKTSKVNTNGLNKNKDNINREGRPVSIRGQIKGLLENDGNLTIPTSQIIKTNEDGSVVVKVPTQTQIALKLQGWAMSKKGNDSLKAIQMIMEQIDGKPLQEVHQETTFKSLDINIIDTGVPFADNEKGIVE